MGERVISDYGKDKIQAKESSDLKCPVGESTHAQV